MTCILRKDNLLVTDSLIFNARPSVVTLEYENKICINRAKTACIVFSGNNFVGSILTTLDIFSNIIVNKELLNEDISIEHFPKDLKQFLDNCVSTNLQISISFFTKNFTYHVKSFQDMFTIFPHKSSYFFVDGGGSAHCMLDTQKDYDLIKRMQNIINIEPTVGGPINVFDLNQLKSL